MTQTFNQETPASYIAMLGKEKFSQLWAEYLADAEDKFIKAAQYLEQKDSANLRIVFHSLKSSSLIFGLDKFSALCAKIESDLLAGDFPEAEMSESKSLWSEGVKKAQEAFSA